FVIVDCRLRVSIDDRVRCTVTGNLQIDHSNLRIDNSNLAIDNLNLAIRNPHSTMLIIDSLLVGGLRFVLDKIAAAVDTEMNDDSALREQLLAAQMRLELGEMSPEQFNSLEADILARLREIRERRQGA